MDRSLAITLGIAAIVHAIALAVVRPGVRQEVAPTVVVESQDVIELMTEEPVAPTAPATIATGQALGLAPAKVAAVNKTKDLVAIAIPSAGAIEVTPPAGAASSGGGEPTKGGPSKVPSLINLDSPGSHGVIFPTTSAAADGEVSKDVAMAKKLDAQLKGALDAKDTENGTGFGGPVVSAAHTAWYSSTTLGWATFDVTTDSVGTVTGVRVAEYSGGADKKTWDGVASDIRRNLEKTKLRVPPGANGVSVRVRLEADMKYPSGATTPVKPIVCPGIPPFCGEFDLADIGQSKKRVVQVRIVAESRI